MSQGKPLWADRLQSPQVLLVVAGPTASGKTELALRLVEALARAGQAAEIVGCDALQIRLQVSGIAIPYQFFQMIPYVATVVVLSVIGTKQAGPKANGQPYRREQR